MPRVPIRSIDDRRLEPYRNLKFTSEMRRQSLFVAEGDKLAVRLLQSRYPVHSLLAGEQFLASSTLEIPPNVTTYVVTDSLLREIVGFKFHRGVLACGIRGPDRSVASILETSITPTNQSKAAEAFESHTPVMIVVCVGVQDPTNLGTILRTSQAFGANAIVLAGDCADPFSRRVLRVSMGASLELPIAISADLATDLEVLRSGYGMTLIAAVASASGEPLDTVGRTARVAVLFGNESDGLSDQWSSICDRRVTIPMAPNADSLNVGVATGIFLYQLASLRGSRNTNS